MTRQIRFLIASGLLVFALPMATTRAGVCNILGPSNCQLPVNENDFPLASGSISDLTTPPHGTVAADDFIPTQSTLTSVCVWGFYHDAVLPDLGCQDAVDDEFRVRVFADADGVPGVLLGESLVTGGGIVRGLEAGTAFEAAFITGTTRTTNTYSYTLVLDNSITVNAGAVNWLEVANNTRGPSDGAKTCWWNWLHHYPQNGTEDDGYSVSGANSGGVDNPANYLVGASRYIPQSGRPYDLAFCVGTGSAADVPMPLDPMESIKAACWTCPDKGAQACTVESLRDCNDNDGIQGIWNRADPDCSAGCADVEAQIADTCTGAPLSSMTSVGQIPPCGDGILDPGEQCDPGPDVPGDNCDATCQWTCPAAPAPGICGGGTNNLEPCDTIADCPDPTGTCDLPVEGDVRILAGLHARNTNCGGTDGPDSVNTVEGNANVGNDSWFFYETTCIGRLYVSACPTQPGLTSGGFDTFDNVLVLYHDPDELFGDPFLCPVASSQFQSGLGSNEGCNGIGDAGGGILDRIVLPGEKWTIRMTNWGETSATAGGGPMLLDVDCIPAETLESLPPSMHQIPDAGGTLRDNMKGRYLPVVVNNVAREVAIQVEFVDLPPPYDLWNGAKLFARAPVEICEESVVTAVPPGICRLDLYTSARLECTDTPFFTDWNALGVVNLWHEGIVPGAVYRVRVLDAIFNPSIPANYSDPTTMNTAPFGQTVGIGGFQFPVDPFLTSVYDALAGIAAFGNTLNKPSKSRTELASKCITATSDMDDVLISLLAFAGGQAPQAPATADACASNCPDP